MTRLIDNMERQHLVVRISDKKDRRTNLIHLTKDGKELEEKARIIAGQTLKEALHGITLEELSIGQEDMYKRQIKDYAILKSSVTLYPPGIFIIPHVHALCIPCSIFTFGIPANDVNIMHSTIMESRAFIFVSFTRCQSRSCLLYTSRCV